jgi:hypothetical protein
MISNPLYGIFGHYFTVLKPRTRMMRSMDLLPKHDPWCL